MNSDRYLFRGQTSDNEWVIGYYTPALDYQLEYITQIENFSPSNYQEEGDCVPRFKQVAIYEGTVGQCTGLKDKNDKLIFEGDIISFFHDPAAICTWNHEWHQFEFDTKTMKYPCKNYKDLEIIGNIHDNPELLEVTK